MEYPQDTKTTGTVSNRKLHTGSLLLWKIRTGTMRQFLAGKMGWKDRHHYQIHARQKRCWRQEFSKATIYTREGLINSSFVIPAEAAIQQYLITNNWIPGLRYAPPGMTA